MKIMHKLVVPIIIINLCIAPFAHFVSYASHSNINKRINQTTEEIKIGGLFPLTGSLSIGGKEREAAFRMAIKKINQDNTLLPNYDLIPIVEDTGTDASTGVAAAQSLIDRGAVGLIGASSSSVSLAIANGPSKKHMVPQISYSSTSPILSNNDEYPFFARVVPSDNLQTRAIVEVVKEFGWDVISILRASNLYSQGISQGVTDDSDTSGGLSLGISSIAQQAADLGIEIAQERTISDEKDIKSHLQNIKYFGSNIILINVYIQLAIDIFDIAEQLSMTSDDGFVWIGTDASSQDEIIESNQNVKSAMQGMLGLRPLQPENDAYESFLDTWESCFNENQSVYFGCGDRSPNVYAPFAYDAVYLLAESLDDMIQSGQDYSDGELLMSQIKGRTIDGITGRINIDSNGERRSGYDVVNLQDEKFVKVGEWDVFNGFEQSSAIYWDGKTPDLPIPQAKLTSSWFLLLTVIIFPAIIYSVRKLREIRENKTKNQTQTSEQTNVDNGGNT